MTNTTFHLAANVRTTVANVQMAKLARTLLREAFPGSKFKVVTERASAQISIEAIDGPTEERIASVFDPLRNGLVLFDGMPVKFASYFCLSREISIELVNKAINVVFDESPIEGVQRPYVSLSADPDRFQQLTVGRFCREYADAFGPGQTKSFATLVMEKCEAMIDAKLRMNASVSSKTADRIEHVDLSRWETPAERTARIEREDLIDAANIAMLCHETPPSRPRARL